MALKCGIVGLPNVGKSTLFNCVSSGKAQSANFPFCTIEKIIVKNGMQIMFFVSNPMSGYYQSKQFERIIGKVNDNPVHFKINQDKGKLRTVSRGVNSLETALKVLRRLQ